MFVSECRTGYTRSGISFLSPPSWEVGTETGPLLSNSTATHTWDFRLRPESSEIRANYPRVRNAAEKRDAVKSPKIPPISRKSRTAMRRGPGTLRVTLMCSDKQGIHAKPGRFSVVPHSISARNQWVEVQIPCSSEQGISIQNLGNSIPKQGFFH